MKMGKVIKVFKEGIFPFRGGFRIEEKSRKINKN